MVEAKTSRSARRISILVISLLLFAPVALLLPSPLAPVTVSAQGTPQYADASNGLPTYSLWVSKTRFFDIDDDGVGEVMVLGPRKGAGDRSLHVFKWDGNSWSNQSDEEGTTAIGHSSYGGYDLGDLDNDGDWDVGVGSHGNPRVDSYLRFGDSWVRSSNGLQSSEDAWSVDVGDFNSDGNLDLAVGGFWERSLFVYAGDGNGNWIDSSNGLGRASSKSEAHFCDVNNDGHLDIVTPAGHDLDTDEVIWVYRGDGAGNWHNSSQGLPASGNGNAAACGDFNNDGNVDIALAFWDGTVGTYLGDGTGSWSESSVGLSDLYYEDMELVDLNNDKLDDLVAIQDSDPGRVHIFLRDGGGFWTRQNQDLQGNAGGWRVDVADFDHNGHPDIVAGFGTDNSMDFPGSVRVWEETSTPTEMAVTLSDPDGKEYLRPGSVQFIRWLSALPAGTGDRTVKLELSTSGSNGPYTTLASDLPDTGLYQWTVPEERTGNGFLRLTLEDDLGASATDVNDRPFGIDMPAGSHVPIESGPLPYPEPAWLSPYNDTTYAVAWGDVDRDGDDDLAVGTIDGANLLYYSRDGKLESEPSWTSNDDDPTEDLTWGDINDDGWIDLVAGNGAWGAGNDKVYLNDRGTLATEANWTAANSDHTNSVALGDYDNDGDLDLATGVYDGYNCIYRNDDGVLTDNPVWYSQNSHGTHAVAWADLDDDDDLDLVAGNGGTMDSTDWNRNNVYENQGPAWDYRLTNTPTWYSTDELWTTDIEVVDLDADGDVDVLAANGYGNDHRVVLYQNQWEESGGDDHLDPDYSWTVAGGSPYEIDVGDVNGDTTPDLAVCHHGGANHLYLNTGTALATESSWNSSDEDNSQSISLGDLEGDGRLDLAIGNQGAGDYDGHERVYSSNRPPTIIVLDPSNNSLLAGDITIQGTVFDPENDAITAVDISIDGGDWSSVTFQEPEPGQGTWSHLWQTGEDDNGPHTVVLRAQAGTLWSQRVELHLWVYNTNYPPHLTLDQPQAEAILWGEVTVSGTFVDVNGDPVEVSVSIDDGPWREAETDAEEGTWSYLWDVTREDDGPHDVAVRGFDGLDHSARLNVTVTVLQPNRPPTMIITSPVEGTRVDEGFNVRWVANDPDDDELTIRLAYLEPGSSQLRTFAMDQGTSGRWDWETAHLDEGTYTLVGSATDGEFWAWHNVTVLIDHTTDADLSLDDDAVLMSPREPVEGDEFTLQIWVENQGSMAGETTLTFTTMSGPEVDLDPLQLTVPADKLAIATVSWIAEAGTVDLMITASPAGPEDDESDNEIIVTIEVARSGPTSGGNGDDDDTWLMAVGALLLIGLVGGVLFWRHRQGESQPAEGEWIPPGVQAQIPLAPQAPVQPGVQPLAPGVVPPPAGTASVMVDPNLPAQAVPPPEPEADIDDVDWSDDEE